MTTLAIRGCGMVSALGFNAPASLAALRAGVSGVRSLPLQDFESGETLRGAKVDLPHWWEGVGKLADLLAPAIDECLQEAGVPPTEVPILLGVAERGRPARFANLDTDLLAMVQAKLGVPQHPESRLYPQGQTGCSNAMVEAHRLITQRKARCCVVAGVDSYLQQEVLDVYIEQRRVLTPANSNGFLPGEAGCAVLVAAAGDASADELRILGFGVGREAATIGGTEPLRAEGLTRAVRQALASAGIAMTSVPRRLTDISGEQYMFKEALFAMMRTNLGPRAVTPALEHPIEYLGHIGAAILPCLLAWAWHGQRQRYFEPDPLLIHVGSDEGDRAALIVQRHGPTEVVAA
jgi:3-oxoacyl-[acyl-carrier-protein] synthase I